MTSEVWQDVPGFPHYQASSHGRIRSLRSDQPRILTPRLNDGYEYAQLKLQPGKRRNQVAVHRMVLLAFHGQPPEGKSIGRHLDGNKSNNRSDNLAWGDHSDNWADAVRHGTALSTQRGEHHPCSTLSDDRYADLERRAKAGENVPALAAEFGVHSTYVYLIRRGRGRKSRTAEAALSA